MLITKPQSSEYNAWYENYIRQTPEGNILELLTQNQKNTPDLFRNIAESKANFAYAEGKWTIKEILGHIIDSERVFAFRLFWFLRKGDAPMPSFDQDEFMKNAHFANRTLKSLADEFAAVRESTLFIVREISEKDLAVQGIMSGNPVSIRALLYIIAGHEIHHLTILKERYL